MQRILKIGRYLAVSLTFLGALNISARAETTVFAASSLREAVETLAEGFEAQSGAGVVLSFAASSAIANQAARGAPADVVLLADADWGDWLQERVAAKDVRVFATNRLVLVAEKGRDPIDINGLSDVLGGEYLAMAQVDSVPAGRYGKAALQALGLWEDLHRDGAQIVQTSNVRAALRFVERGDAAFAVGYASDLVALPGLVLVYDFPAETHAPITYTSVALTPEGLAFADYLTSAHGQQTLTDWGFGAAPAP